LLQLNPHSVRAHSLAGNVAMEVPGLFGGDKEKAEEHFKKGLAIDPKFTVLRIGLARRYLVTGRYAEARGELQQVIAETAQTNVADWTVKDLPRARKLLEAIKDKYRSQRSSGASGPRRRGGTRPPSLSSPIAAATLPGTSSPPFTP